jgi:hypothetical protein
MPFGLTGGPSTFQHYINDVLHEYLDIFCTAYLDDILIYSNTLEEHREHVKKVLIALRKANLQADIEKCDFHALFTKYLGLIIGTKGVEMDPKKVFTVKDWPIPSCLKDIQAFLGFANFYRRFIQDFSLIVKPLTNLTKKDTPFHWDNDCQKAFDTLKQQFITAPILKWFDEGKEIIIETDASDFVVAAILSQRDSEGVLHPIAYFSKKMSVEECNYEIYDKELLAIIRAFEEWRPELEGSKYPITVITDHRNLEYFMTTKQLNRRQARWSEFLSRFTYKIVYRPGKQGAKPDSLTRRSGDLPREGDIRLTHQSQVVIKPENIEKIPETEEVNINANNVYSIDTDTDTDTEDLFVKGYTEDSTPNEILQQLRDNDKKSKIKAINLAECSDRAGQLYYRDKRYVPDYLPLKLHLLQQYHDSPIAGHPGRAKTFELLSRHYYWPDIFLFVKRYTKNCQTCHRVKPLTTAYQGVLKPLPIPQQPWQDIAMDFVTGLPPSQGYNAILNVIDRLTGMNHLIPCNDTTGAEELAKLYLQNIWKLHGLPLTIISDRGPQFVSKFWKALCQRLKIQRNLSTAYHPQTDGKTERANAIMEQYLRAFTSYQQDDWVDWLPLAEFNGNSGHSETIKTTPFFANYGYHPRLGFEPLTTTERHPQITNASEFAQKMEKIYEFIRAEALFSQAGYETYANRKRQPAPAYKIGDMVYLSTRNLQTERPAKKLDWKYIGPYKIQQVISPYAYKLQLPSTLKIWPVFHTSLLSLSPNDPFEGQTQPEPPPVIVNNQEEYEVEVILDSRLYRQRLQYLVKWTGYDDTTWEPYIHVKHLTEKLRQFHKKYPQKPSFK